MSHAHCGRNLPSPRRPCRRFLRPPRSSATPPPPCRPLRFPRSLRPHRRPRRPRHTRPSPRRHRSHHLPVHGRTNPPRLPRQRKPHQRRRRAVDHRPPRHHPRRKAHARPRHPWRADLVQPPSRPKAHRAPLSGCASRQRPGTQVRRRHRPPHRRRTPGLHGSHHARPARPPRPHQRPRNHHPRRPRKLRTRHLPTLRPTLRLLPRRQTRPSRGRIDPPRRRTSRRAHPVRRLLRHGHARTPPAGAERLPRRPHGPFDGVPV